MPSDKKNITKSELVSDLSEKTNLSKSQINSVLDSLTEVVEESVKSGYAVIIPGLVKIYVHKKAATKARQMKSPATGEMINVPAKPARKVIKVKPIKNLKDAI
jgi:nucleoid DNA-binding protein